MRNTILFIIWALINTYASFSQTEVIDPAWFITRGGSQVDEAWGVDVDSAGNIYWATHQTVDDPRGDIHLYKLNPLGTIIWEVRWGGQFTEQAYIVTVKEPYVYVGGTTWKGFGLSNVDLAVICFNISDGSLEWEFTWDQGFGYEEVDGLVVEKNGIYAAGWTTGENTQNDMVVLKLNLQGELLWFQTWGSDVWDEANGHIVVQNDKIFVAGRYNAPGMLSGGSSVLVAFNKATGNYLWHSAWKGSTGWPPMDDAYGMTSDSTGLYLTGITNIAGYGSQIFLLKYNFAGNQIWETTWGGTRGESARALLITQLGNILIGGKTNSYGAGENDIVVLNYDPHGNLLWSKTWGGSGIDEIHDLVTYGDILYIVGETSSFGAGKNDALLMKIEKLLPIVEKEQTTQKAFSLKQNYPNPFNPTTTIEFSIKQKSHVSLQIFDIRGRQVKKLLDSSYEPGIYSINFDARNFATGVYFYRIKMKGFSDVKKMVVLE